MNSKLRRVLMLTMSLTLPLTLLILLLGMAGLAQAALSSPNFGPGLSAETFPSKPLFSGGNDWKVLSSGTSVDLNDISCPTITFCVAVGQDGTMLYTNNGGTTWNGGQLGDPVLLHGISCPAPGYCFAVGANGTIRHTNNGGTSWSSISSGTSENLYGISCYSVDRCFAVGANTLLIRFLGGWGAPDILGFDDLMGMSCPTPVHCVAVGQNGLLLFTANFGFPWQFYQPTGNNLNGVSCPKDTPLCFVVGANGTILTGFESSWSTQSSGTAQTLNGISCPTDTACFAVGASGTILHTSNGGSTWSAQSSGTTADLNGISCPTAGTCFAVGNSGTILVKGPNLSLAKSVVPSNLVSPGQLITYTLSFSNVGSDTATGVIITDLMPISITNLNVNSDIAITQSNVGLVTYTWQVQDLTPGQGGIITITGIVSPGLSAETSFTNTGTITTNTSLDIDSSNNQAQVSFTRQADLSITKQQKVDLQTSTITYTLTFSNSGPNSAKSVVITDIVPPGVINLSMVTSSNGLSFSQTPGITYSWQTAEMAVNATGFITISGTVIEALVVNNASITATSSTDPLTDNNQAEASFSPSALQVTSTSPAGNGRIISPSGVISVTFNRGIKNSTVNSSTFTVRGQRTGVYSGTYNFGSVHFEVTNDFKPGEKIVVNLNNRIKALDDTPLIPYAWQFVAAVGGGSGSYSLQQSPGSLSSFEVALGDLDNDTDLDAFIVNASALDPGGGQPNKVWLNTAGTFADSGQSLSSSEASTGVALGDLDNDGDLDAFVTNWDQKNHVLRNGQGADPLGTFSLSVDNGHNLGDPVKSRAVALGDLNGDGHLDAFVANEGSSNTIWLNDGDGTAHFSAGQVLPGAANSWDVALGDLNSDGFIDAYVVNHGQSDEIWLNDGTGNFTLDQSLSGSTLSRAVALGDVDGDGDLDAMVAHGLGLGEPNKLWLNNNGTFSDSGQAIGGSNSRAVALGDVDADGDLDAVFGNLDANKVWLNDGSGNFSDSGQNLGDSTSYGLALGDVGGSGALAIFVANGDNGANKVWLNGISSTGGGGNQVYLPLIFKPDPSVAQTELFVKSINTSGITLFEIRDPSSNALLLSCSNIGDNVTQLCGTIPSVGSYNVIAYTNKCGMLGPQTFNDAIGGSVTRSAWCN